MTQPKTTSKQRKQPPTQNHLGKETVNATPSSSFVFEAQRVLSLLQQLDGIALSSKQDSERELPPEQAPTSEAETVEIRLQQVLDALKPESAQKLCALLIAGRKGQDIRSITNELLGEDAKSWLSKQLLGNQHGKIADELRRGQTIAYATAFKLETPITSWPSSAAAETLEERVWLSFGKQLALSQPSDWECLRIGTGRGALQVTKLYLQLAGKAWWSFQSVLDRPSPAAMKRERQAIGIGDSKHFSGSSLESVIDHPIANEGRALHRALRAIRARIGVDTVSPQDLPQRA